MKFKIKIILSFIILSIILYSCDIIESPYTESGNIKPPDTSEIVQKVLIEDFTGHTCINCPAAHKIAKSIYDKNPGRIVIMAIHAGNEFASPTVEHPYDFRTIAGTEIDDYFKVSSLGLPYGLINRRLYDNTLILSRFKWEDATQEALKREPVCGIKIIPAYNEIKKEIKVEIQVTYIGEGSKSHNLAVFVVEDSIVSYQKNTPKDEENYVHNHVLRTSVNGKTWGEPLSTKDITKGEKFTRSYTMIIPKENSTPGERYYWRPEKLRIIACIMDTEKNYEILQVEEVNLISKE